MDARLAAVTPPEISRSSLESTVHVLATTPEGTKSALVSAVGLSNTLHARIILLLPRLNAFSVPVDRVRMEQAASVDEHRALAARLGARVDTLCCVCQRLDDVVHQMLGRSSLVIVGGRRRAWWPSREQRLVRRLIASGYAVVFAPVGGAGVARRVTGSSASLRKGSA